MLTVRTNGKEPYKTRKVHHMTARGMENAGLITNYNSKFGYIQGDYVHSTFEYKGKKYKVEYFSGCFYPFLLELI